MDPLPRMLVVLGLSLVAVALWLQFGPQLPWLGRFPGDIRVERPGFRFHFPIVTCLILSLVLSLAMWLFSKR